MGEATRPPRRRAAADRDRAARLEKALRDNLRRRKEQARAQAAARRAGDPDPGDAPPA
jgi:hypothetical protein